MNVKPLPLSIVKDKPYSFGEGYLSYCCIFLCLLLSKPPLSRVKHDIDAELNFDFCEGGPFDGARLKIFVYMDCLFRSSLY